MTLIITFLVPSKPHTKNDILIKIYSVNNFSSST